jgi:hypothetical protein
MRRLSSESLCGTYQHTCGALLIRRIGRDFSMAAQQKQDHPEHKFPRAWFFITVAVAILIFIAIFFFFFLRVGKI